MCAGSCRLCGHQPAIQNSHVIPAFVFRAIKGDSSTGFFRNPYNINRRVQDGDKTQLLCADCEQRFACAEQQFASDIFLPFHQNDRDDFSYGAWLHYFLTSLAWRTLVLELPGFQSDLASPNEAVVQLGDSCETMRKYLMGESSLASCIQNHIVVWAAGHEASSQLAAAGPNVLIRRSAFGYTVLTTVHGYSGVLHNLAGIMCFLIINGHPRDNWIGTNVNASGGNIKQPQQVTSWLMQELLETIIECKLRGAAISQSQHEKIGEGMRKNSSAKALRFRELDKRLTAIEPEDDLLS